MKTLAYLIAILALGLTTTHLSGQSLTEDVLAVENQVIEWRRYFHQHAELSNREFKTSKRIAQLLKKMGLKVQTGIAHTGVVAVLDSGKPGPVIALRADIDGLPITEQNDLPFKSTQQVEYNGQMTGVMHACGHDTHIAMLLGAAKVLTQNKDKLKGKVKFIFQPAEEGAPAGEEGGAELMVKQGVLKNPDVDVIYGLHISSDTDVGVVEYRSGGIMAAVDPFRMEITGKQVHGAYPWGGIDPIVTASQIIMGLQTIVSRELELIKAGAVVTVGSIHGGNRSNIIPNKVVLEGTIRSLDDGMRQHLLEAVKRKATLIAESMRAQVKVEVPYGYNYPVTYNDPDLMQKMLPTLERTVGEHNAHLVNAVTGAEDFSFFQQQVPGLYLFVGGKAKDLPRDQSPAHHTPEFYIDESGMKTGVELLVNLTIDSMH